jgi:hypothetical protein
MKLKFNKDVRKSIAEELKKVSNFGGVGLGFMGYSNNSPTVLWATRTIAQRFYWRHLFGG